MSAQAIGPTLLDQIDQLEAEAFSPSADSAIVSTAITSSEASIASDLASQYNLDGSGQTIAIIDSGIAWDHADLGGGFGAGNKVVGGWDFAENDADPYDDGPAGFHGTHVAGIAAGTNAEFGGVARGADLVGLRVFNDAGVGEIEWVEAALQWVHDNLDSFQNPITTVNMSLGTDWNGENTPNWGILEDELAALKAEGVFISVAAGNDFEDYFKKGLSYPASSEHVVPVSSHGPDNQLSDFSQRDDNVLVAPGERVRSTVPDHIFGNQRTDSFLGASGTSMAAPYVAGASAVLREAYAFMGYGDVDQDTIYDTFLQTSNKIYDAFTNTTYQQLDLDAAIASIIKDVHSNLASQATDIGSLNGGELIRGTIGKFDDVDQFKFNATANGQVEFVFETSHDLDPSMAVTDSNGNQIELEFDGERVYFNVVAGQQYQLKVTGSAGTGHYEIATQFQRANEATAQRLGIVDSVEVNDFVVGDRLYSVEASRSGPMAFHLAASSSGTKIEVYDAAMNRITSQQVTGGEVAFQMDVEDGEIFFIRVESSGEIGLTIDNLITVQNDTLFASGTDGADSFFIRDGEQLEIGINGTNYTFDSSLFRSVGIHGNSSEDTVRLELSDRFDQTILRQNRVDSFGGNSVIRAIGFQSLDVSGSGKLTVAGSAGDDTIIGNYSSMSIVSENGTAIGRGFDTAIANGKGGFDTVTLSGDDGDDLFFTRGDRGVIQNGTSKLVAIGYETLEVDAKGGSNVANLRGSAAADRFELGENWASVTQADMFVSAKGFQRVTAFANHDGDQVFLQDSAGDDHLSYNGSKATFSVGASQLVASRFRSISVSVTGGYDVAQLSGSAGNDNVTGSREQTVFTTNGNALTLNQFDRINVVGRFAGSDRAVITGSDGNDIFVADERSATVVFDGGTILRTVGLSDVVFDGGSGFDTSRLTGSAGSDRLVASENETQARIDRILAQYSNVESTQFDGNGGIDDVFVDDIETLDLLSSLGDRAIAVLENHRIEAEDFDFLEANAVDDAIAEYDIERVDFESVLRGKWKPR
jgi:hypothetical protein